MPQQSTVVLWRVLSTGRRNIVHRLMANQLPRLPLTHARPLPAKGAVMRRGSAIIRMQYEEQVKAAHTVRAYMRQNMTSAYRQQLQADSRLDSYADTVIRVPATLTFYCEHCEHAYADRALHLAFNVQCSKAARLAMILRDNSRKPATLPPHFDDARVMR